MKGRGGGGRSGGMNGDSNIIAAMLGFFGGSVTGNTANTSLGDGIKYGVKCTADDNSDYCQNVKSYNEFQMVINVIMRIITLMILMYVIYMIYIFTFSKKGSKK